MWHHLDAVRHREGTPGGKRSRRGKPPASLPGRARQGSPTRNGIRHRRFTGSAEFFHRDRRERQPRIINRPGLGQRRDRAGSQGIHPGLNRGAHAEDHFEGQQPGLRARSGSEHSARQPGTQVEEPLSQSVRPVRTQHPGAAGRGGDRHHQRPGNGRGGTIADGHVRSREPEEQAEHRCEPDGDASLREEPMGLGEDVQAINP